MVFSDLISTSFLFSVAIIIILIGGIFAYVSNRMSEQDHKLTTMVNLVSMLAQDLQSVKTQLALFEVEEEEEEVKQDQQEKIHIINLSGGDLIPVSDDEDEDVDVDVDEDEDEDIDEDIDDEDDIEYINDIDDDEDEDIDNVELDNVEVLNVEELNNDAEDTLGETHSINFEEDINIDLGKQLLFEQDINDDEDINGDEDKNKNNIKTITLLNLGAENPNLEDLSFLKNIEFSENNEPTITVDSEKNDNDKTDYKKMSLNKLREIVVSKGVVTDASKLKKHDILKLLGDE